MPAPDDRHYATWDARGGRTVRALCGTSIRRRDHANDPTCRICQDLLRADARQLALLQAAPDPDPVMTPKPFDPCAGYTPRERK